MLTRNIMVVDSSRSCVRLLDALLTNEHWRVYSAADGGEALALARDLVFDVALLSMRLPDMHGCDLALALGATPGARHVPILAVSASDSLADRLRARRAGIVRWIPKPIDVVELRATVALLLDASFSGLTGPRAEPVWTSLSK